MTSVTTWDELDANAPCPNCGCIDNGHSCEWSSVLEAVNSVEPADIKTPNQAVAEALNDGLVITASRDGDYFIASAENGDPDFDATVIGRPGDDPLSVIVSAIETHYANVAALVNGEK